MDYYRFLRIVLTDDLDQIFVLVKQTVGGQRPRGRILVCSASSQQAHEFLPTEFANARDIFYCPATGELGLIHLADKSNGAYPRHEIWVIDLMSGSARMVWVLEDRAEFVDSACFSADGRSIWAPYARIDEEGVVAEGPGVQVPVLLRLSRENGLIETVVDPVRDRVRSDFIELCGAMPDDLLVYVATHHRVADEVCLGAHGTYPVLIVLQDDAGSSTLVGAGKNGACTLPTRCADLVMTAATVTPSGQLFAVAMPTGKLATSIVTADARALARNPTTASCDIEQVGRLVAPWPQLSVSPDGNLVTVYLWNRRGPDEDIALSILDRRHERIVRMSIPMPD